jgi:hypothetical protein
MSRYAEHVRYGYLRPMLSANAITDSEQRHAALAGLDETTFSGHLIRAGFAISAAQQASDHNTYAQLRTTEAGLPMLSQTSRCHCWMATVTCSSVGSDCITRTPRTLGWSWSGGYSLQDNAVKGAIPGMEPIEVGRPVSPIVPLVHAGSSHPRPTMPRAWSRIVVGDRKAGRPRRCAVSSPNLQAANACAASWKVIAMRIGTIQVDAVWAVSGRFKRRSSSSCQ